MQRIVCLAQTSVLPCCGFQTSAPRQTPSCVKQVERERVLPGLHVGQRAGALDDGPHHLLAGGVAQGVDDAVVAVAPFAAQGQLAGLFVEAGSPLDQLADARGRLADDHLDDFAIAQRAAGRERVGDVVLEAVLRVQHAGDAPLGIVAVGLLQAFLGDHQHR